MSDAAKNLEKSFKVGGEVAEHSTEGSPQPPSTVVDLASDAPPQLRRGQVTTRIVPARRRSLSSTAQRSNGPTKMGIAWSHPSPAINVLPQVALVIPDQPHRSASEGQRHADVVRSRPLLALSAAAHRP